jgi:hypothetical protein
MQREREGDDSVTTLADMVGVTSSRYSLRSLLRCSVQLRYEFQDASEEINADTFSFERV